MQIDRFLKSSIVVALGTFLSRLSGFPRELMIAYLFGASNSADAVNVAFRFPNLFRRIFAEGALSSVFIPIFNDIYLADKKQANIFANQIAILLTLFLVFFIGLMEYFMPQIVSIIAPGFSQHTEHFTLTVYLCRVTLPYLLFVSLCALIGGILNSLDKFASFSFNQVIFNVTIVFFTLSITHFDLLNPETAIAIGVILGGFLQLFALLYNVHKSKFNLFWPKNFEGQEVSLLLKRLMPAIISYSTTQLNLFISQIIASFISGAISVIGYAERIYQLPLSIFATTFSTVLLPNLSKLHKTSIDEKIQNLQSAIIRLALILTFPCAVILMFMSTEFVEIIYERGSFSSNATIRVANILFWFSLALPAFSLVKIYTTLLYSRGQASIVMRVTIYTLIINTTLNYILINFLQEVGIAIGSTIAAWINLGIIIRYYHISVTGKMNISKMFFFKLFLITLSTILSLFLAKSLLRNFFDSQTLMGRLSFTFSVLIVTAISYIISLIRINLITIDWKSFKLIEF